MKAITAFEVVDHGIENSQYFQGCGISGTEFHDVVTGIGNDAREALDDACENLAQAGWDTAGIDPKKEFPRKGRSVPARSEDCYYYVSVRVR